MTVNRLIPRVLILVLMTTSITVAQNKRVLTTADYDRATRMLAPSLNGLVVGGNAEANWLPDGRFWYVRTTLSGTETPFRPYQAPIRPCSYRTAVLGR